MGLVVSSAYKTNTVSSVSGTQFNSNGTPFAAGDVGRCIRFTNGNAAGQSRKIVTYNSTTRVTLDYAWNTSPIDGITESLPTAGDTWVMSHNLDDLDDATNLVKHSAYQYEFVGTGHSFTSCFLYDNKKHIYWTSDNIVIATSAAFRFGDILSTGETSLGCSITDSAATTNGLSVSGNSGDYEQYGGSYISQAGNVNLRLYRGSAQVARMVDVQIYGAFGFRAQGSKSAQKRMQIRGNTGTGITCADPMGVISGVDVRSSDYGYFWNVSISKSMTVTNLVFANLGYAVWNMSATGVSTPYQLTINGIDLTAAAAQPTYINVSGIGSASQVVQSNNSIAYTVTTTAGAAITSPRVEVKRSDGTVVLDTTPAGGVVSATFLECVTHTISTTGNKSLASGTDRRPFTTRIRQYNYFEYSGGWDGNQSVSLNAAMLPDTTIVQTTLATVTAYTTLGTLDKLRDYWKYRTTQDMTFDDATVGGGQIDLGARSLTVDASAGSVWAYTPTTATIKASAMAAGSTYLTAKLVNLTLSNAATWAVPVSVSGVASVGPLGNLTGNITLTGTARLDFTAGSGATASAGSAASGTTVRCTSASSGAVCDFRAFTFASGSTFENTSGQPVTLKLTPTQTVPTLLATSGTITLDNAVSATLTVSGFASGSDVIIYNADLPSTGDGTNVIATYDSVSGTSQGHTYTYAANTHVNVGVFKAGKVPLVVGPLTLGTTDSALPVTQLDDRNYAA